MEGLFQSTRNPLNEKSHRLVMPDVCPCPGGSRQPAGLGAARVGRVCALCPGRGLGGVLVAGLAVGTHRAGCGPQRFIRAPPAHVRRAPSARPGRYNSAGSGGTANLPLVGLLAGRQPAASHRLRVFASPHPRVRRCPHWVGPGCAPAAGGADTAAPYRSPAAKADMPVPSLRQGRVSGPGRSLPKRLGSV